MKTIYSLVLAATCGFVASDAQAQLITWEPATNMFQTDDMDESFVSTNGTLVEAVNGGSAIDSTVNGVVFVALPGSGLDANGAEIPTNSNGQVTTSPGGFITVNDSNSNDGAFQGGEFNANTEVTELIHSGLWACNSVTLSNLVIGNTYEIQVINNDARPNRSTNFIAGYGIGDASGPVGQLLLNSSPTDGSDPVLPDTNVGQTLIGTFTADATSLTFECFGTNTGDPANLLNGDGRSQINGLQLRDITMAAAFPKGDVNQDTVVDFLDLSPFISLLTAGGFQVEADVNCDNAVDFLDISPFVTILSGP